MKYASKFEMDMAHQKRVNEFPMFFAFNDAQFDEGLEKLGVGVEEIVSTFAGGFIRKRDIEAYRSMMEEIEAEKSEYRKEVRARNRAAKAVA